MKKRLLFILLLISAVLLTSACYMVVGVNFDELTFEEQLASWKELDYKNYSFTYTERIGLFKKTEFSVTVKDGEKDTNKNARDIYCIEDLFDYTMKLYDRNVTAEHSGNVTFGVSYHPDYYFPNIIKIRHNESLDNFLGDRPMTIRINSFLAVD